jgi:hypothetical protein
MMPHMIVVCCLFAKYKLTDLPTWWIAFPSDAGQAQLRTDYLSDHRHTAISGLTTHPVLTYMWTSSFLGQVSSSIIIPDWEPHFNEQLFVSQIFRQRTIYSDVCREGGKMKKGYSLRLTLIVLFITAAGCQPPQYAIETAIAQTQVVQSTIQTGIAETQVPQSTQTLIPTPTVEPSPTSTATIILDMKMYLNFMLQRNPPTNGVVLDAKVNDVNYQKDANGNVKYMVISITEGDNTNPATVYAIIFFAFKEMYGDPAIAGMVDVPNSLSTFEVVLYNVNFKKISSVSGSWSDVVALGKSAISLDQFLLRLNLQK